MARTHSRLEAGGPRGRVNRRLALRTKVSPPTIPHAAATQQRSYTTEAYALAATPDQLVRDLYQGRNSYGMGMSGGRGEVRASPVRPDADTWYKFTKNAKRASDFFYNPPKKGCHVGETRP